jgi:hypothetical protein
MLVARQNGQRVAVPNGVSAWKSMVAMVSSLSWHVSERRSHDIKRRAVIRPALPTKTTSDRVRRSTHRVRAHTPDLSSCEQVVAGRADQMWPFDCLARGKVQEAVMKSHVVFTVAAVVALTSGSVLATTRGIDHSSTHARHTQPRVPDANTPKLAVRVTPLVLVTRGDARGVATVPRHADNRMLRVILESADYYAMSQIQLDGEDAPQNHLLYWRDLPPGAYAVTIEVYGTAGCRGSTSIGSIQPITEGR